MPKAAPRTQFSLLSPDGKLLLAQGLIGPAGTKNAFEVWPVGEMRPTASLAFGGGAFWMDFASPDELVVACHGASRSQVEVWSVSQAKAVHTFPLPRPVVAPAPRAHGTLDEARIGERRAYFGAFVSTAIYERARLPLGARLAGPAIVEQTDTTTVIPPGVTALVDEAGNLRLRRDR